jgi:hypothetical protein
MRLASVALQPQKTCNSTACVPCVPKKIFSIWRKKGIAFFGDLYYNPRLFGLEILSLIALNLICRSS